MRYGFIATLVVGVGAALFAAGCHLAATPPGGRDLMQDQEEAKSKRILSIYARAKAKLDLLGRERRLIVERYAKKIEGHRAAEARKRLEDI